MPQKNSQKKTSRISEWSMAIGSLIGLVFSITEHNPTYFVIGLAVGIAIGYSAEKRSDTK